MAGPGTPRPYQKKSAYWTTCNQKKRGEKRPANLQEGASKPDAPKKKKSKAETKLNLSNKFPTKVFNMLQNEDASVVSWTPSGDAFIIRDRQRFVNDVLPRYFRSAKVCVEKVCL